MAYSPYEAVKAIYNLKGIKNTEGNAGNKTAADKAEADMKKYYQELYDNNYGVYADVLSQQNYAQAKNTYDKVMEQYGGGSTGTTQGAAQSVAQSPAANALSKSQIDTVLAKGATGAANSLAGQDLYSQWDQRNNDWYNYFDQAWNTQNSAGQSLASKNNQYWDTIYGDKADMGGRYDRLEDFNYSNPFTTEQGRSVLERYDLAGLQGRDNQAAIGGADNGGNIDSFAAANALRQQAALRNLGEQSALAAHSRTVGDGRGILGDRGSYLQGLYNNMVNSMDIEKGQATENYDRFINLLNQYRGNTQGIWDNNEAREGRLFNQNEAREGRLFNENETAMNNQVGRDVTRSELSGNTAARLMAQNMGLVDDKDNLINPDINYHAKINELIALRNTIKDPQQLQNIDGQIEAYNYARQLKVNMDAYKQYSGDNVGAGYFNSPTPTASMSLAERNSADTRYVTDSNLAGIKDTNLTNKEIAFAGYAKDKYAIDVNKDLTLENISLQKTLGLEELASRERINSANLTSGENQLLWKIASDEKLSYASLSSQEKLTLAGLASNEKINDLNLSYQNSSLLMKITEEGRQFDETMDYNKNYVSNTTNTVYTPKFTVSQLNEQIKNGNLSPQVLNDYEYYNGVPYTTSENNTSYKPKFTVPQLVDQIDSGNLTPNVLQDYEYYYGLPYDSFEETSGVNTYSFDSIDKNAARAYGVDDYGWNLLQNLKRTSSTTSKGGVLTEREIFEIAVSNSKDNNTNLDQIKKVFKYLGIDTSVLNRVKDAGFFFWQWGDGVKAK